MRNFWKPLKISENLWKSLKISEPKHLLRGFQRFSDIFRDFVFDDFWGLPGRPRGLDFAQLWPRSMTKLWQSLTEQNLRFGDPTCGQKSFLQYLRIPRTEHIWDIFGLSVSKLVVSKLRLIQRPCCVRFTYDVALLTNRSRRRPRTYGGSLARAYRSGSLRIP